MSYEKTNQNTLEVVYLSIPYVSEKKIFLLNFEFCMCNNELYLMLHFKIHVKLSGPLIIFYFLTERGELLLILRLFLPVHC